MSTMVDYGYGSGAPDTADKYGYGSGSPDSADKYGYGDGTPSTSNSNNAVDYGYGDAQPDYGYGDAQPDYGYGDAAPDGANEEQPKQRTRRRNSVTRYSLVCQDKVVNEFNAHANAIDQFRNGGAAAPTGPPPDTYDAPLNDGTGDASPNHRSRAQSSDSIDGTDGGKKKKRGWGFFGRSATN